MNGTTLIVFIQFVVGEGEGLNKWAKTQRQLAKNKAKERNKTETETKKITFNKKVKKKKKTQDKYLIKQRQAWARFCG